MSDDKDGAPVHQRVHSLFNELFRPGVNGAGGLIQNQHRRAGDGCPRNSQKLALPLGQVGAVAVKGRIITLGQTADEGVGIGCPGRIYHVLVRGVQPSVTYVVRYGSRKQVGILDDHGKGTAQIVLFNGPYVNAVIGYASLLYFVETVHQIDNGGLSCSGGTYERDFLPGFGVEAYAVQDGFFRRVSEHNLAETHIPLKGNETETGPRAGMGLCRMSGIFIRYLPGEAVGKFPAFFPAAIAILSHITQCNRAFVQFLGLVHHIKNPLGSGQGCQKKVYLLGELVHGHGTLAHIHQIGCQSAQIRKA